MVNPPPTVDAVRRALDSDVKIGVTSCEPFPDLARIMEDRIAAGQSGGLGFTFDLTAYRAGSAIRHHKNRRRRVVLLILKKPC